MPNRTGLFTKVDCVVCTYHEGVGSAAILNSCVDTERLTAEGINFLVLCPGSKAVSLGALDCFTGNILRCYTQLRDISKASQTRCLVVLLLPNKISDRSLTASVGVLDCTLPSYMCSLSFSRRFISIWLVLSQFHAVSRMRVGRLTL